MNKSIKVMVASALLSMGLAAHAGTQTETSAWVYDITNLVDANYNPISAPITLNGFNTSLGTLQSVQYTIIANISGDVYVENQDVGAQPITAGGGANVQVSASGLSFTQNVVNSVTTNLGGYDGVLDFDGASGAIVALTPAQVTAVSPVYSSLDASWNPNYFTSNLVFDLTGLALATGPGNASYMSNPIVDVKVQVSYIYAPVPEPETYGMLLGGLALMGAVARRKMKKAA